MGFDGAAFAQRWADRYTRGLPDGVRDRRRAEIACDVFEQAAADDPGSAIAWRAVRGMPADVVWRRQEVRRMRANEAMSGGPRWRTMWSVATQSWFAPLVVLLGVFNVLTAIYVLQDDESKMPGQLVGPLFLVALTASLFGGLWLRWRSGRASEPRAETVPDAARPAVATWQVGLLVGVLVVALAVLVVGVAAGAHALFFLVFVLLALTLGAAGLRAVAGAIRSSDRGDKGRLADGMIIVGTLPGLAFFWMIVPALLAVAVIGGVLGTDPKVRPAG